ncbi:hypothetical protein LSTR_LSTR012629 [Laodelphax striatellus]|uniref:Uncharacterized protein n=1 Tax=Laodelphax striatellus TaxID=195883 RepID=A0A482WMX0_LAOST|nr:hypothetical protein LSTR_LSTR012629 [Laodelphax striatellus]
MRRRRGRMKKEKEGERAEGKKAKEEKQRKAGNEKESRSVKSGKDLKCHFACAPAFIKKRARCKLLLLLLLLQRCCLAREKRQTCRSLALSLSAKCCRC